MEQKSISISTIPIPKLTTLMNNFICNTITHLNKLSVKGDEKLAEFDKKLNDLEIMTTLLESKLNSLPQTITSTYPPLEPCTLDDINPSIIINPGPESDNGVPEPPVQPKPPVEPDKDKQNENVENPNEDEGQKEEEISGDPKEALENFLKQHESFRNLQKMIQYGAPLAAARQKAKVNGFDMDVLEELINLMYKVNPNIS
jgi:hypothetical protein